jgi:DNA-directed RNA polymerase specialized sigma24 family protein
VAVRGAADQPGEPAEPEGQQRLGVATEAFQHRQVGLAEVTGQRAGGQQLADQVLDAPLVGGSLLGEPVAGPHPAVQRRPLRTGQRKGAQPGWVDQRRPLLFSIAYRILGSVSEAEDAVQETWLRYEASPTPPTSTKAFLSAVVARISIEVLRSARVRREEYLGPWFPEPLLTDPYEDPERSAELADSLSMAVQARPALVELLGDADEQVRQRAIWALPELGMPVLPLLQHVRHGGPPQARHGALEALADLAGEQGLSQRDRLAVGRLIRVKLHHDQPQPFIQGSWLAVPGADQAGLIDLLGLSAARPATFALGLSAVANDDHGWQEPRPPHPERSRVFITPELDGWTLVVGGGFLPVGRDREAELLRVCRRLGGRYGTAQAFAYDELSGWSAWTVADDHPALFSLPGEPPGLGRIVRHHIDSDDEQAGSDIGAPPPAELALPGVDHGEEAVPRQCRAIDIAEALSVNPQQLGPHTPMRGHGLLALTTHGAAHGVAPGALRI